MSARDAHYGRRGGNWLPDGYDPVDVEHPPLCEVCGAPMMAGQERTHHGCQPDVAEQLGLDLS